MKRRTLSSFVLSVTVALAALGMAGTASAAEPTPSAEPPASESLTPSLPESPDGPQKPDNPEVTAVPDQLDLTPSPDDVLVPDANPDCTGQWAFTGWSAKPDRMGRVGPNISSYFGNGGSQTLTAGISGSLSYTFSESLEAGAKIKALAEVKLQLNGSVSANVSVNASVQETQPVPKGYWGNAFWGRFRVVVTGDSYQFERNTCKVVKKHRVTMYAGAANKAVGWCKWVSKGSLGSRPAVCDDGSKYIP